MSVSKSHKFWIEMLVESAVKLQQSASNQGTVMGRRGGAGRSLYGYGKLRVECDETGESRVHSSSDDARARVSHLIQLGLHCQ